MPEKQQEQQNKRVLRAAVVLSLANVIQRVLGMGREIVKANLFGASGTLSAFTVATLVPMTLYNLIVGGEMVTSSLVPVFSDYANPAGEQQEVAERRRALWEVFSIIVNLTAVVLLAVVLLVELFAPQVAWLVGARDFNDPELFALTVQLMRLTTPAVLFLSLSSIMTAVLYALQRFTLPAFTIAMFNAAVIVIALLWPEHISSLAWGVLVGAVLQVVLQLPALRDAHWQWRLDWRHPAVRKIIKLYTPIIGGLLINQAVIWISYRLAIQTGDESVTYMVYATTLYQLPLGLVVMGLSTATLPTLSQQAQGQLPAFKSTLAQGLRLVVALILPAAVGMFVLAQPIVALLFEHGRFTSADTAMTSLVLQVYVFGMPFAAVDQMLVYASYARKDTLRPALVGVVSIIFYLIIAITLQPRLGLLSLMAADAAKHVVHTLIMLWLLQRHLGGLRGYGVSGVGVRALVAAVATGGAAYGVLGWLPPLGGWLGAMTAVALPAMAGVAMYGVCVWLLDIEEAKRIGRLLRR